MSSRKNMRISLRKKKLVIKNSTAKNSWKISFMIQKYFLSKNVKIFFSTKHTKGPNYSIYPTRHKHTQSDQDWPLLTSSGRFRKIQPDSGWMSKYLRSSLWKGAAKLYLIAPLLSASSSEAETLKMLVPMFVSCLTFSMYFCKYLGSKKKFQK